MDAQIIRRALYERSELARPPKTRVRPIQCGRTGGHWFLVLFPKEKDLDRRSETRHQRKTVGPHCCSLNSQFFTGLFFSIVHFEWTTSASVDG